MIAVGFIVFVVVYVYVVLRVDVDLSGGVTSGELLVGIGTLALAYYTAQLASATYLLDKRNAERERFRRERQVRGIARLVREDLRVVQGNAEVALDEGWPAWFALPHGAWDRDAAIIAETVSDEVAESLVVAFSWIGEWETIVTRYFLLHPRRRRMPKGLHEHTIRDDLLPTVTTALKNLDDAIPLPSGAEAPEHQDPDQRRDSRLRRLLLWPLG